MSADRMPQLVYAGSAPLEHSQYMHELVARIQNERPPKTLLAKWALSPDDDITDRANWARVNPSLGMLISEDYIEQTEYLTLSPEDFAAERLGVAKGGVSGANGPISIVRWAELTDGESMAEEGSLTLGLDAPIDRRSACFVIYGRRADGLRHAAIRYWVPGHQLGELATTAKQLCDGHGVSLFLPPKSPALAWRDDLIAADVPVVEVKAAAFAEAQQAIEQAVVEGALRHRGQPEMNQAVSGLAARVAGDQSPWSRRSSAANVAPLFAAAAALAGAATVTEPVEVGFYD